MTNNDAASPPLTQVQSADLALSPAEQIVGQQPLTSTAEWLAYAATPTGTGLAALIARTPLAQRGALVEAIETLFFERGDWRVAQHAAMLHLDRFEPRTEQPDLVKALCFADHACLISKDDPRARLMLAAVSWERRLPLAILHDVEVVRAGEARLRAETSEPVVQKVLGEALLLEGLARAYLQDVAQAHECLIEAGRRGALTGEAVIQLLISAEPDFPVASAWAASLLPSEVVLGGRAEAVRLRSHRRRFLWLLHARGANV